MPPKTHGASEGPAAEDLERRRLASLTWWTRHSKAPAIDLVSYKSESAEVNPSVGESDGDEPTWENTESGSKEHGAASPPCWRKLYFWFCGISSSPAPTLTKEEKAVLERKLTSIVEKPLSKTVCNINAIILLAINVFLWGYFG